MNKADEDGTQPLVIVRKKGKAKLNVLMRQAPKLARALGTNFQIKMEDNIINITDKKEVKLNKNYTLIPEAGSLTPAHVMNDWFKNSIEIKKKCHRTPKLRDKRCCKGCQNYTSTYSKV